MNSSASIVNRAFAALTVALVFLFCLAISAAPRPSTWWSIKQSVLPGGVTAQVPPAGAQLAAAGIRRASRHTRPRIDARAAAPRRIEIPAIGVSAPVIALGLNGDGTIQTPRAWSETGWYKPGPEPGERGPAVVVGHVDSTTGPAVFFRLRDLRAGDLIRIRRSDGSKVGFRVQRVERWPKAEFPSRRVYGPSHGSVLRLVTCSGRFDSSTGHYADNTIVYASRV